MLNAAAVPLINLPGQPFPHGQLSMQQQPLFTALIAIINGG